MKYHVSVLEAQGEARRARHDRPDAPSPTPTAPLPRQPPTRAPAADLAGPVGRPLGSGAVRLTSGLLAHWQQRNREVTVPHTTREIERAGNLENLRRIADDTGSATAGRFRS